MEPRMLEYQFLNGAQVFEVCRATGACRVTSARGTSPTLASEALGVIERVRNEARGAKEDVRREAKLFERVLTFSMQKRASIH